MQNVRITCAATILGEQILAAQNLHAKQRDGRFARYGREGDLAAVPAWRNAHKRARSRAQDAARDLLRLLCTCHRNHKLVATVIVQRGVWSAGSW